MSEFSPGRKMKSFLILAAGIIAMLAALIIDFTVSNGGNEFAGRGPLLVVGMVVTIIGIYLFPTLKHHRAIVYGLFLFPLLFTFLLTVIIPMGYGICYSFTDWDGIQLTRVVGFDNYVQMFKQPGFLWSIVITSLFVIFNVILVNLFGFLLALLCTTKIKAMGFFRASYFLPNLIGGIVLGYVWKFIFNKALTQLMGSETSMLSASGPALAAIVIVYIWQYGGYIMLIYITGLTAVPADTLEAASIDGANSWDILFKIKLPMIAPTITICTFLTLTSAFKQFDVNLALTNGAGSVKGFLGSYISNGTEMIALNIYHTAFTQNNYALSQAKAVLFFIILAVVSIIQVRTSNKKEVSL
jgi:raffinose/stachyose/melibiose transport system permease protein